MVYWLDHAVLRTRQISEMCETRPDLFNPVADQADPERAIWSGSLDILIDTFTQTLSDTP